MLVDIKGEILVQTHSRRYYGVVAALPSGDALYTFSDNIIQRVAQTGKISAFIDIESSVYDILTVNDDVFVSVRNKIFKLSNTGIKTNTLDCDAAAMTSLSDGNVAVLSMFEKMMVIQANDCRVVYKDIDVSIGSPATRIKAFTADKHGRIIRGHGGGTTIHVFQLDGEKVTQLKEYNVKNIYNEINAVDTDESGNLWIGTRGSDVIISKYYQSY